MQTIYDAKILIVDDNQDLLNLVTTALRSTGYNQLTACTGCAAAQAAFAANRPDLMILDINLPDGDGFTLFRTLHSMADIPALFLSARDADADRLFGLGLGADDYLTKPFLTQELLLRIQRILQRCYRGELWRTAAKTLQLWSRPPPSGFGYRAPQCGPRLCGRRAGPAFAALCTHCGFPAQDP